MSLLKTLLYLTVAKTNRVLGFKYFRSAFAIVLLLTTLYPLKNYGQPISRAVPFTLSTTDTTHSDFLPAIETGPAGKHGAWSLSADGHCMAADGTRLKFFGTELESTANFIDGNQATIFAKRLRKMGFNAVRLNYFDYFGWDDASVFHYYQENGIPDTSSYAVNPVQLAKLDTLIYVLKQEGIYTFITLNSYHDFSYGEGIAGWDSSYANSALLQFLYPQAAYLQHQWARTLLGHVNPLTGLALGKDPAIACYEMKQEESLPFFWQLNRLNYIDSSNALTKGLYTISYHQSRRLDTLYNAYLKRKYGTDQALHFAWTGNQNVDQRNLLSNGSFQDYNYVNGWGFNASTPASAVQSLFSPGIDNTPADLIHITEIAPGSNPYAIVIYNNTATTGTDSLYQFSFWAKIRFDPQNPMLQRPMLVFVGDGAVNSLLQSTTLDTTWTHYSYTFRAQTTNVQFAGAYLSSDSGDVLFDNFALNHVPEQSLSASQTLATSTVPRAIYDSIPVLSANRARDQVLFYDSLQQTFYDGMNRLIKDTLQCVGLVNFSQANYWGTLLDYHAFQHADVTETHTGWDYISARGSTYSDSIWMIRNTPMVRDSGFAAIALTAAGSVAGKANILGGWSVPSPNQYASEQAIIPVVYAAYQNWDGIFFTPYAVRREELFTDSMTPGYPTYAWNDISFNHALMAQMPFASMVFRNGLVSPSTIIDTIHHDADDVDLFPHYTAYRGPFGQEEYAYGDQGIVTSLEVRERYDTPTHDPSQDNLYSQGDESYPSLDGHITWTPSRGVFRTTEPNVYAFTGFITDSVSFPNLKIERLDQSQDNISMYYLLGYPDSAHALLSISTRTQNSGVTWLDSNGYGGNYGHAPTLMSAAKLRLTFQSAFDSVTIYPLDSTGNLNGQSILAQRIGSTNKFTATIDQQTTRSVWYAVSERMSTAAVAENSRSEYRLTVTPNPVATSTTLTFSLPRPENIRIDIFDDLGHKMVTVLDGLYAAGSTSLPLDATKLASGHYLIRMTGAEGTLVQSLEVIH